MKAIQDWHILSAQHFKLGCGQKKKTKEKTMQNKFR